MNLSKLVNFCAGILILKMEESMQHFLVYYALLFQEREKYNWKAKKKICAVYGEGAVTDGTCQKRFAKFLGTIDILAK